MIGHVWGNGVRYLRRYADARESFGLKQMESIPIDEIRINVPDMLDALTQTGWHNYSIFARDDGLIFGYFEAKDDFETSLEQMCHQKINAQWQEFMAPYFEIPTGARPDQMMVELEEIFHVN